MPRGLRVERGRHQVYHESTPQSYQAIEDGLGKRPFQCREGLTAEVVCFAVQQGGDPEVIEHQASQMVGHVETGN